MNVHPVNWDLINDEAERIKKEQGTKGNLPDLNWSSFKDGDNVVRLLPPYNASGRLFRPYADHWELAPDKKKFYCMLGTWPDQVESCYFCSAIDDVLNRFPDRSLGKQKSSRKWLINVLNRDDDEEPKVSILRITPGVYNWLILQMKDPKIGDVTDISEGVDLKITKQKKKRKDGKSQIEYVCGWIPRPAPLHESDEVTAQLLGSLPDLDRVLKFPTDDSVLSEWKSYSVKMKRYYINLFTSQKSDAPTDDDDEPPEAVRGEGSKEESDSDKDDDPPPPAKESSKPQKPASLENSSPSQYPTCFAGLDNPEPHAGTGIDSVDGTIGFSDELEKCMLCKVEMKCLDIKESKGL